MFRKNKDAVAPQGATDSESAQRYYSEGATWENDIARRNRWSRSLAWVVAAVASLIAAGAIGALVLALPLKTYEPYMVVVDRSSGFVEVKRPIAEGPLTQDEAIATFDVVRYVKARETYDPKGAKDNFDLAQLLSTGAAARDLTELYSPANPRNPIKILGRNATVAVKVKSVTFPNQRTALVRFSTEEKSQTNIVTRNWVSLLRFRYTSTPAKNEYRFSNPLGFQVTEYRRDQETAPSPGAAGAVAPSLTAPAPPATIVIPPAPGVQPPPSAPGSGERSQ
jgi:type IV secretion system protein VirB8